MGGRTSGVWGDILRGIPIQQGLKRNSHRLLYATFKSILRGIPIQQGLKPRGALSVELPNPTILRGIPIQQGLKLHVEHQIKLFVYDSQRYSNTTRIETSIRLAEGLHNPPTFSEVFQYNKD